MAGSVLTQHLSTGSHTYVCVWTRWDYRLRECRCATYMPIWFYFNLYLIRVDVLKYDSDKVNAIQSKRKVSGSAAYVSVKFN